MDKNKTVIEALQYYRKIIENNQDKTLSDKEKQSVLYLLQKYIYKLGNGNWERGAAKFSELEKEKYEQEKRDNPALVKFLAMRESNNPTDRMFAEFILQDGLTLPEKDSKELQEKLLREEIYKSASQLPAQPAEASKFSLLDITPEQLSQVTISADELKKQYEKFADIAPPIMMWKADAPRPVDAAQVDAGKPEPPTRKVMLDRACIEWVNRDNAGRLGRYTRDEFLDDFEEKTGQVISRDEFRRALEDAQEREIIVKINGRLKPKTRP